MLGKMNFDKYQKFLHHADSNPEEDHKFVVFEYVESPSDVLISRSERLHGTQVSIHSVIKNPEFDDWDQEYEDWLDHQDWIEQMDYD